MRWKPHVRFGERAGETDRQKRRHRAPARLHGCWCFRAVGAKAQGPRRRVGPRATTSVLITASWASSQSSSPDVQVVRRSIETARESSRAYLVVAGDENGGQREAG